MARPKKAQKVKEPVRIRERKLKDGSISLYLDIYQKGSRKVESLGLYIVQENTPLDRQQNKQARQVAEKIKADRILALRNFSVKQWDKVKRSSMSLVAYLIKYEKESFGFSASTLKGRKEMRLKVEEYLKEIGHPEMTLAAVDVEFVKGFITFLGGARNGVRKDGATISNGCAHHHQAVLNGALNKAVREGIIKTNPLKAISSKEKYQPTESIREYLTLEELKHIMTVPCPHDHVKKAFLFSCFTGLRLGDVQSLTWNKIQKGPDGKTFFVRTIQHKTGRQLNIPLSNEALACLDKKDDVNEPIFSLPTTSNIERILKLWMEDAGITKHITYHCSRHTCATMLLTLGVDIYTVSKMLGHSNLTTTQIYAKIVDQKKIETVSLVDNFFGN